MEQQTHRVVKSGGLQATIRKKEGTLLLRRKKLFYQPEQWMSFCVHNEKIPFLEWYDDEEGFKEHTPEKVRDLLYCMFVNPVFGDERGFVVGFCDNKNSTLEFCAPNAAECLDWIATLTGTLRDLNCLGETENIYTSFTRPSTLLSPSSQQQRELYEQQESTKEATTLSDVIGAPGSSMTLPLQAVLSRTSPLQSTSFISSPPLQPRSSTALTRARTLLTDEIPMQTPTTSHYYRSNKILNEYTDNVGQVYNGDESITSRERSHSMVNERIPANISTAFQLPESVASASNSLRQLSCYAASNNMPEAPLTPTVSSPLRIISKRIQNQHYLHMSLDQQQLDAGYMEEALPPLPPRKSQQQSFYTIQRKDNNCSSCNNGVGMPAPALDSGVTVSPAGEEDSANNGAADNMRNLTLETTFTGDVRSEIYDMLRGNKEASREQYDVLPPNSNYDILSARVTSTTCNSDLSPNANVATTSFCERTSSSLRTYSESTSSCQMRLSSDSSRTSTSGESRRSVTAGDSHTNYVPSFSSVSEAAPIYDVTSQASRFSHKNPAKREQYDFPSSPPLSIPTTYSNTFREALNKPRTVSLLLADCVEHLIFVELGSKVWIAGWTQEKDFLFKKHIINFGDEVCQVGDEPIRSIEQIPHVFYEEATPGVPIDIKIRSIPHGSVYSLTKPLNPKKSLGITLHNKKNRIAAVENKSPAWIAQVPVKLPQYVYGKEKREVPAVITQVDGLPLNPFAKDEQFFHRVESIPSGASFNIIVHPMDMVKLFKAELKNNKHYKKFLHSN